MNIFLITLAVVLLSVFAWILFCRAPALGDQQMTQAIKKLQELV